MKVFKYQIPYYGGDIKLPKERKILTLQLQHEDPCIWVEVNPESPQETLSVINVETGIDAPLGYTYLGTCLFDEGAYVAHYYYKVLP